MRRLLVLLGLVLFVLSCGSGGNPEPRSALEEQMRRKTPEELVDVFRRNTPPEERDAASAELLHRARWNDDLIAELRRLLQAETDAETRARITTCCVR